MTKTEATKEAKRLCGQKAYAEFRASNDNGKAPFLILRRLDAVFTWCEAVGTSWEDCLNKIRERKKAA